MENVEMKKIEMQLTADNSQRIGTYSNSYLIRSNESEAIIDFCFIDEIADDGLNATANGVLASRIIMSVDGLEKLRDAINDHIKANISSLSSQTEE